MTTIHRRPKAAAAPRRPYDLFFCAFLLLATIAVYSQVGNYDFVNYDDREYVTENPHVRAGLTADSVAWAFTSNFEGNWIPLTWLSHMLDVRLFGLRSGLHHWTNVALHLLSTLLLFAFLRRTTHARWPSAAVAFLFALHPLHVESVAWVAERKDVLSAVFWFLALWCYARYVERPNRRRYVLVLASFCFGLMAKSMVVTLPFVLLLMDIWPLSRIPLGSKTGATKQKGRSTAAAKPSMTRILWEKAPFFALSAVVAAITYVVQQGKGAVVPLGLIPFGFRLGNALIAYMAYIFQMLWPLHLSVFYPMPLKLPAWQVIGAVLGLGIISVTAIRWIRRFPFLAVGWFWYAGTLVPVIGLVQVGMQARADRYTYLPSVGIFIILVWGAALACTRLPKAKTAILGLSFAAGAICILLAWFQIRSWKDSAALFGHALQIDDSNYLAHNGLGVALREQGKPQEAIPHYLAALRIRPAYPEARANLGDAYLRLGRTSEAIQQLREAVRLYPYSPEPYINLGIALDRAGKVDEAIAALNQAMARNPDSANAHYNLGRVLAGAWRTAEAITQFHQAIRLQPDNPEAHYNLGTALASQDDMAAAANEFQTAIRLKSDYADAYNNLGSALANLGRIDEAIAAFSEAVRIEPGFERARRNLEYAVSLQKKR